MENIKRLIEEKKLISEGDVVGVGVSGGKDSMALLVYLHKLAREMNFEVVAITINHGIRENGASDASFVMDYCKKHLIRAYRFNVNALELAKEKKLSVETSAREARYGVFEAVLEKNIVDKIALAHHKSDQVETVLLHLLRGSGINGIKGMGVKRDKFIRPMLETDEKAIWQYVLDNDIPNVQDETNLESEFSRNYIRNEVLPVILKKWPNAMNSILNFAELAKRDDEYINKQLPLDGLSVWGKEVKIPLTFFGYDFPIVSRLILRALGMIGVEKDIEAKHIEMIINFAKTSENGKRIDLPNKIGVFKDYDFLTITNKFKPKVEFSEKPKLGTIVVPNLGKIVTKKTNAISADGLFFDPTLVPKDAVWRFRENGDVFEKFGGGTKKLKDFLIDKKIPNRERATIPVLASGNKVYIVLGVEIADSIKVTQNSKKIYQVRFEV